MPTLGKYLSKGIPFDRLFDCLDTLKLFESNNLQVCQNIFLNLGIHLLDKYLAVKCSINHDKIMKE